MSTDTTHRSNRVRLDPLRGENAHLRLLARRCSALWNTANYQCRQRFFAKEGVPGYTQLCTLLGTHPVYRSLPSDIAQEVLKKLSEAWSSYFKLRRAWTAGTLPDKPGLPRYRKDRRTGEIPEDFIPVKSGRSYAVDAHHVCLTLPRDCRPAGGGRLLVAYRGLRRHHGSLGRAEARFDPALGRWYFQWSVQIQPRTPRDWTRAAAIDLGIRVLASLSIENEAAATHYHGREVLHDYDYFGRQIARHQKELAHREHRSSRRLRRLHQRRRGRLLHAWEAIAKDIVRRCKRARVGVLYVGWPKDIRRDMKYGRGRWAERIHNFWSFAFSTKILEKHLRRARIRMVRVGERGTSSTCTVDPDPTRPTHEVVRHPRHLLSCRTCGLRLHSDQVGSRNLLRFQTPGIRWDGPEAGPRTETLRWQCHRWVDSGNPRGRAPATLSARSSDRQLAFAF